MQIYDEFLVVVTLIEAEIKDLTNTNRTNHYNSIMSDLEKHFSKERLYPYVASAGEEADLLYLQNLKISEAFYSLIAVFEVAFRNRINDVLTKGFNDPNWIIKQAEPKGYMTDPKLGNKSFQKRKVDKAKKDLGGGPSPSQIIAQMSLGFWVEFFSRTTFGLIQTTTKIKMDKLVFNTKPRNIPSNLAVLSSTNNKDLKRSELKTLLDKSVGLRNRIAHHEPIIFKSGNLDWDSLEENYRILCYLISWIDPDLNNLLVYLDSKSILDLIDDGRTLTP